MGSALAHALALALALFQARNFPSLPADKARMELLFDHERLKVYQRALDFFSWVYAHISTLPRGHAPLLDQLRRAASSIVLNVAEGAGRFEPPDKRRFYLFARGSAVECSAILDVMARAQFITVAKRLEGRKLLWEIVAMLVSLAKGSERVEQGEREGEGEGEGSRKVTAPAA